ncbi:MAG: hypothetical protein AABW48_04360 [Nanoarchaeota archaeon]
MEINVIIGLVGMVFILLAFILDEFYKKWSQNTIKYNLINIIGSGLLVYYAVTLGSWPFILLNGVWLIVATVKLVKIVRK